MCTSVTCNPYSNLISGLYIVEEKREELPFFSPVVCIVGSTLLYPFALAASVIGYIYFSNISNEHKEEIALQERENTKLLNLPENDVNQLTTSHLAKLYEKKSLAKDALLASMPEYTETIETEDFALVKMQYRAAVQSGQIVESPFPVLFKNPLVTKLELIQTYKRIQGEIDALTGPDGAKDIFHLKRAALISRSRLLKQKADHQCKLLAMGMIPLLGIYFAMFTGESTSQALNSDEVNRHNHLMQAYPWLQPV